MYKKKIQKDYLRNAFGCVWGGGGGGAGRGQNFAKIEKKYAKKRIFGFIIFVIIQSRTFEKNMRKRGFIVLKRHLSKCSKKNYLRNASFGGGGRGAKSCKN